MRIVRPRLLNQRLRLFHLVPIGALHQITDDANQLEVRGIIFIRQLRKLRHLPQAGIAIGRPHIDHREPGLREDVRGYHVPLHILPFEDNTGARVLFLSGS